MQNHLNNWLTCSNSTAKYVSLGENTVFVECCGTNEQFDQLRNDGRQNVYIPAEVEDHKLVILCFSVNRLEEGVVRLMQVKRLQAANDEKLSCFGGKLSDDGIFWLCIFNMNMVAGIDILNQEVKYEFLNVPCPYHICICESNNNFLYVTGGSRFEFSAALLDRHNMDSDFTESTLKAEAFGRISVINIETEEVIKVHNTYLSSLSGVECSSTELFYTQLFDICKVNHCIDPENPDNYVVRSDPTIIWSGSFIGKRDQCYLVDNISKWDDNVYLGTIYKSISLSAEKTLRKRYLSRKMRFISRARTKFLDWLYPNHDNLSGTIAEVPLAFQEQDEFADCCFVLFDRQSGRVWNMKMPVPACDDVNDFDGHITHVQRHGGKIIFVNYKSSHILLIDEEAVVDEMVRYEKHYFHSKRNWLKKEI